MAGVIATVLTLAAVAGAPHHATVDVTVGFTPREIADKYNYAINIQIFKFKPEYSIVLTHRKYDAIHAFTIPESADSYLGIVTKQIQPDGNPTMTVRIETDLATEPASNDQVQAIVSVVPENVGTSSFSNLVPIP